MLKKILNLGLVAILSLSMLVGCEENKEKDAEDAKNLLIQSEDIMLIDEEFSSYGGSFDVYTDKDTVVMELVMPNWILEFTSENDLKELADELNLATLETKKELEDIGNEASVQILVKDNNGKTYISAKDGVID